MRNTSPAARARQRGAVLATVGIFMVVLVAMAVVGVDVGRLAFTATETQVTADAGAVAYAKTMLDNAIYDRRDVPFVAADLVVADNVIDGKSAIDARIEYAVGQFNFETRDFRPGGFPANAVQATSSATVDNFFAGIFGDPQSTVHRNAVAAFGGAGQARPALPIAVGDCYFRRFQRSDDCSDLPRLEQVPERAENSCWTSLRPTMANASEVMDLLPAACCSGGRCGGGATPPLMSVGDEINVLNGQANAVLQVLEDCVANGLQDFIIPIVECGKCNQQAPVVGFASVHLTRASSRGKKKGLDIEALCKDESEGGAPGQGANFGVQTLALVE